MNEKWYIFQKNNDSRLGVLWASRIGEHVDSFVSWFQGTLDAACRYAADLEAHEYSIVQPDEIPPAPWGDEIPKELVVAAKKAERNQAVKPVQESITEEKPAFTKEETMSAATSAAIEAVPSETPGNDFVFELEDYTQEIKEPVKPKSRSVQKKKEGTPFDKYEVEGQLSLFDII